MFSDFTNEVDLAPQSMVANAFVVDHHVAGIP